MVLLARLVHLRPLKNLLFGHHHPGPSSSLAAPTTPWTTAGASSQPASADGEDVDNAAKVPPRHPPVHWSPLLTAGMQLFHTYYYGGGGGAVLARQLGALRLFGNCGLFDGGGIGGCGYVALGALNVIGEGQERLLRSADDKGGGGNSQGVSSSGSNSSSSGDSSVTKPNARRGGHYFCTKRNRDSPLSKKQPEVKAVHSLLTYSEPSKSEAFPHLGDVFSVERSNKLLPVVPDVPTPSVIFDITNKPRCDSRSQNSTTSSHSHVHKTARSKKGSITRKELESFERKIVTRHRANVGLEMLLGGEVQGGLTLLRLSAEEDDVEALHNVGVANERGMFEGATLAEALSCYSRAASLGHGPSLHNLAVFHQKGLAGLEVDGEKARELLDRAQEVEEGKEEECAYCKEAGWEEGGKAMAALHKDDGFYESLYRLARAHHLGFGGLAADCDRALQLYQAAAAGGHKRARRDRAQLVTTLATRLERRRRAATTSLRYSKSAPSLSVVQYAS